MGGPIQDSTLRFVCPLCKQALQSTDARHACQRCRREYPIICGIPDFRVEPDPYISIDDDRQKGQALFEVGARTTFDGLLRHYYAITPEDPPDLAERWMAHARAEVPIAAALMRATGLVPRDLLDIGCSTGGLLIAAQPRSGGGVGVDVAFRWLVVGLIRLREHGAGAQLVCANAEYLPFPDARFGTVTCTDTLEHVRDAAAVLREARRVSAPGASLLFTANNRFAPLPEANIRLWGVGYLPRRCQPAYVAARRRDLHPYRICVRSAWELKALARAAGLRTVNVEAAPLFAPDARGPAVQRAVGLYNAVRRAPVIRSLLTVLGPRLVVTASATASRAPSPSAAAPADT